MISNSTAEVFSRNNHKFDLMYAKRAFDHWYLEKVCKKDNSHKPDNILQNSRKITKMSKSKPSKEKVIKNIGSDINLDQWKYLK